jgi:hypothetical protein
MKKGEVTISFTTQILIGVAMLFVLISFGLKLFAPDYSLAEVGAERYFEILKEKIVGTGQGNNVFRIIDNGKNSGEDKLDYFLVYFGEVISLSDNDLKGFVGEDVVFRYSKSNSVENLICVCYFYDGVVECDECEELDLICDVNVLSSESFVFDGGEYWVAKEGVDLEVNRVGEVYVFSER